MFVRKTSRAKLFLRQFQQVRSTLKHLDPNDAKRKGNAVLFDKLLLFDETNELRSTAHKTIETLNEMKLPFLIVSRERVPPRDEWNTLSPKLGKEHPLQENQVVTVLSMFAENYDTQRDKPWIIIGGHENYFSNYGFKNVYTKQNAPTDTENYIFTDLKEEAVQLNVDYLLERIRMVRKQFLICAFQDGPKRLAKRMVRAIEDEHVAITDKKVLFSYFTTATLAFHAKRMMEMTHNKLFRNILYLGSSQYRSNLGSELHGLFTDDMSKFEEMIMMFLAKSEMSEFT